MVPVHRLPGEPDPVGRVGSCAPRPRCRPAWCTDRPRRQAVRVPRPATDGSRPGRSGSSTQWTERGRWCGDADLETRLPSATTGWDGCDAVIVPVLHGLGRRILGGSWLGRFRRGRFRRGRFRRGRSGLGRSGLNGRAPAAQLADLVPVPAPLHRAPAAAARPGGVQEQQSTLSGFTLAEPAWHRRLTPRPAGTPLPGQRRTPCPRTALMRW